MILRHPAYKGLVDIDPSEIVIGEEESRVDSEEGPAALAGETPAAADTSPGPMRELRGGAAEVTIDGRDLRLSNLDKVMYPKAGFAKGQLVDYYARISPALLPHLHGRPLTMKRYPDGVEGQFFYEKQCPSHRPDWVETASIWSRHNKRNIDFCLVNDLPTLVWAANLADLELHTSLSLAAVLGLLRFLLVTAVSTARASKQVEAPRKTQLITLIQDRRSSDVRQDVRIEGPPGVRAAQRRGHLRPDQAVREGRRRAAREAESEADRLADDEEPPPREGAGRLEPERRAQDDGVRLLAAREGAPDRLDARDLGRGRGGIAQALGEHAPVRFGAGARPCGGDGRPVRARPDAEAGASLALTGSRAGTIPDRHEASKAAHG